MSGGYLLTLRASWIPFAHREAKGGKFFSAFEMEMCAAACERVLPRDEEPGAIDLGVPQFIDSFLDRRRDWLDRIPGREAGTGHGFRQGLRALNRWAFEREGRIFPQLSPERQDAVLRSFEQEGGSSGQNFIRELTVLTLEGVMADPTYGGNKDRAGWRLIGFEVPCPNPSCE
ncbi:MAG TPA: gluconate 2-dehydrogenase subunit 3 family protein [Vicinamibacteria bacterium]|nr:gluconate 2-dehydrogenase subunit 3 family protein [Vicinamibacteria bacterium]